MERNALLYKYDAVTVLMVHASRGGCPAYASQNKLGRAPLPHDFAFSNGLPAPFPSVT